MKAISQITGHSPRCRRLSEEQVWEEEPGSPLGHAKNGDDCERLRGDVEWR